MSQRSMDSYLTHVSNRLGMATKTLGVVATVTLPILAGLKWRKVL
jgi:Mg2+ and Co2+ transporter CorA